MEKFSPKSLDVAAAWHGSEIGDDCRWQYVLEPQNINELDSALAQAYSRNIPIEALTTENFPLDCLKNQIADMANQLEQGCGFVRLRGLPLERWTEKERDCIWMGIALHLGHPVSQNSNGQILRQIRAESGDVGQRYGQLEKGDGQFLSSRARTASNAELRYHTDRCDIVALLCTGVAHSGGQSKLASSVMVHNEMLHRYPESCALLYQDLPRSRIGEEAGGENQWYQLPVWGVRDGKFTSHYSRTYVEALSHVPGAPKISSDQWQALDRLAEIAEQQHFKMELKRGDIQFLNNHVIYHSRTAFEDDIDQGLQRCLQRIWLSSPKRPLPTNHAVLWGQVEVGQLRGGIGTRLT
jgi:hypothetical protein